MDGLGGFVIPDAELAGVAPERIHRDEGLGEGQQGDALRGGVLDGLHHTIHGGAGVEGAGTELGDGGFEGLHGRILWGGARGWGRPGMLNGPTCAAECGAGHGNHEGIGVGISAGTAAGVHG